MIEYIQNLLNKLSSFNLSDLTSKPDFQKAVQTINSSLDLEDEKPSLLNIEPENIHALVIGVDYLQTPQLRLNGCVNDAFNIKEMLLNRFDVPNSNITLLTDDNSAIVKEPTVKNIKSAFADLVKKAGDGEAKVIFVSYSGHGTQTPDSKKDADFEEDGKDECWVPSDFKKAGLFKDDHIRKFLLEKLPENIICIIVSDSCHSGSMADLPLVYNPTNKKVKNAKTNVNNIDADLIQISGCMDPQYSEELKINGKVSGVLSHCITQFFKKGKTLKQLVDESNATCRKLKLSQVPLVSVNKSSILDIPL